jgi:hypothetical protein
MLVFDYGQIFATDGIRQSLAADGAIACFSGNLFPSA